MTVDLKAMATFLIYAATTIYFCQPYPNHLKVDWASLTGMRLTLNANQSGKLQTFFYKLKMMCAINVSSNQS